MALFGRLYPFSAEWDRALSAALDAGNVRFGLGLEGVTCHVNGCQVWVGNWPYAYGSPYRPVEADVLPSRATAKRLRRAEERFVEEHNARAIRAAIDAAQVEGECREAESRAGVN